MKKALYERYPLVTAIVCGIICTLFTAVGSAAAQIMKADEWKSYVVISIALIVSVALALIIVFRKRARFGIRKPQQLGTKIALLCLPLLVMEILPIAICGFRPEMAATQFLSVALFTLLVGLNEELWFRGIALSALLARGSRFAIVVTAVIFGVLHSASLLGNAGAAIGGATLAPALLQIVFAFGVGIALAVLVVLTKSLLIPVIWHFAHDFIAISTNTRGLFGDSSELLVVSLQLALLLVTVIGLWILLKKREV